MIEWPDFRRQHAGHEVRELTLEYGDLAAPTTLIRCLTCGTAYPPEAFEPEPWTVNRKTRRTLRALARRR